MASLWSALSPRKWPGYALSLLGIGLSGLRYGWDFLDIGGRLDVFWRIAEGLGATTGLVTAIILWPWTGILLIAAGVLYVVFVGEPPTGVQRHHGWLYVGWGIVAFVFAAMAVPAIYGAIELHIRTEIAKGVAGAPRGASPAENNPDHPQRPLIAQNRILQPDQIRILKEELPKLRPYMKNIPIGWVDNDGETLSMARQYESLFLKSGIVATLFTQPPSGPEDEGLIIGVKDKSQVPEAAQKLMEAFAIADIHPVLHDDLNSVYVRDKANFILFVAPAHTD
jgi:hypothetical protein